MRIRIGISACLLGEPVRYDGRHKYHSLLVKTLAKSVEWIPFCPEVESGLGVPRVPMRLEGDPQSPHLRTIPSTQNPTSVDHTQRVTRWCRTWITEQHTQGIQGFILKSRSPSCGLAHLPVWHPSIQRHHQTTHQNGRGLFAHALHAIWPTVPVTEGDPLQDVPSIQAFLHRIPFNQP